LWQVASAASVGIEMAVAILIGWWAGSWLDERLGTETWLMLLLLLCGVGAGFKALIREARQASKQSREDGPPAPPAPGPPA
jgi:F0F1-type ATP synthase assembly protein I